MNSSKPVRPPHPCHRRGAASTENIILVSLVAIACLSVLTAFGRQVSELFRRSTVAVGTGEAPAVAAAASAAYEGLAQGSGSSGTSGGAGTGDAGSPFGVTPDAPPKTPTTPEEKLAAAKELLRASPKGREVLKYLEDHNVQIELQSGDGSFYDPSTGNMTVRSEKSPGEMLLTIAHEANHAKADKEHTTADVDKDTREDYVRKMLAEEAAGDVQAIETKREVNAAGKGVTAMKASEAAYDAAYDKAAKDLRAAKPKATAAELDAAGKAAGAAAVLQAFVDGKVITSTNNKTYPNFYGDEWDKRHPK
ncbi:MAG: hypothetical protein HYZ53_04430 [Planctomycetes bacterium]|nr:hypothetical protein [Planctomycetota bacterium]